MIQWMHKLSQSWVATILMGALALSFVVWGIADVFTGGSGTAVATVGSTEIDSASFQRTYRNFLRDQSQRMGTDITPEMAQKMGLADAALQQMVNRVAIDNEVQRLKLTTPDDALVAYVRSMPAFQGVGGFNHDQFLRQVQNAGYTEQGFLNDLRVDMTRDQLTTALEHDFALPDSYVQAVFQYLTERRAADYVILSPDSVPAPAPPSDQALAAYVKDHPDQFSSPEYRSITYAQIGPQDLTGKVTITEAMIAQDYEAHKSLYQIPEKRDIQQIEFPSEADAVAARAKLDKGETFEALAAERKIAAADLDLGALTKADLGDPARADAAFSLKEGEVSQPIKAVGGYVLLKVVKITPAVNHPLADVHDTIKNNLALQQAGGKLIDVINAYEDARSGGAEIEAAAQKAGMKSARIAQLDKNGLGPEGQKIEGLPTDPEFLAQVFATEPGEDTDPFQGKSGEYYAVKVNSSTSPKLKPLDQVRDAALAAWTQEQKAEALAKKAAELAAQAEKDKNVAGVAAQLKVPVQHSPALTRQTNDTTFSTALVQRLFALPAGGITMAPQGTGSNYIIAQVTGITHEMTPQMQAGMAQVKQQLSQEAAGDFTVSFADAARLRQGVKVDQKLLQSVVGGNQ